MSPLQKRNFRSYSPPFHKSTPSDRKRTLTVPIGTVVGGGAGVTRDIFRAPSECLLDQISIVTTVALGADATNFWQFDVKLLTSGTNVVGGSVLTAAIQQKTALAANVNLDLAVASNVILGPNDVLQLQVTKNGMPVNLQDLLVVVDWEVTGSTTTTSTSTTTTTTTSTSSSTSTSSTTTTSTSSTTTIT